MNNKSKEDPADFEYEERDDAVIGWAFRWSLAAIVVLGVAGGLLAYFCTREQPEVVTPATELKLPDVRDISGANIPSVPFADITDEAGVTFRHINGSFGDKLLPETMGGGCGLLDYDGDGDQDILFVNSSYWTFDNRADRPAAQMALYRNDGGMQFTDVTVETGLDFGLFGMGCAVGDYDNDGDPDLFLSALGPNRLLRNDDGRFVDVTEQMNVAGGEGDWSTSCGFLDYDNDGQLDLVVCNYLDWTVESNRAHDFRLDGGERAYGPPTAFGGTFSFLYHNEGGRFVDVTEEAGLQVRNRDTQVPVGKSLGVVPVDVNRDGWMDIVVANDTVRNFFFQNQRDGTFKEAGTFVGIAYGEQGRERGAMGIDAAFFRNNSALGVVIGNFYNEMTGLFVDRDGQMLFSDEAVPTGLGPPTRLELTFGVFFFDYDLDGRLDIFAANGHLEEDIGKVQESQHYEQSPQLFWNTGGEAAYEYVKVSSANSGEAFFKPLVGRAAVFGDLDNDGDLDVIITSCGQRPRILRNDQQLSHHWLRFRLTGTRCNRDAIGAVVEVRAGDETFRRRLMPTRSYLSQTERVVTIGLGKREDVDQVTIHWPDGSRQEVEVLIDSMNEIIQSKE